MPYRLQATTIDDQPGSAVGDASGQPYGVAVRDIFSDARWSPAEPVRARGWRDTAAGDAAPASETDLD